MNKPDGLSGGQTIRLHSSDNTVVAAQSLPAAIAVPAENLITPARIPKGHKLASRAIAAGEPITKYGQIIGEASVDIAAGEHVHVHNVRLGVIAATAAEGGDAGGLPNATEPRSFDGYRRADGQVGTRNYLGILTSVNCSATVARLIAQACEKSGLCDEFPNIDGVIPLVHGTGCGMSGSGDGLDALQRTIHGYARNPNFGGILLVGLGCEVMQLPQLMSDRELIENPRFRRLVIQNEGGTRRTVERGIAAIRNLAGEANSDTRTTVPMSALRIGLQCGGSDAYSGITANPALGIASDMIVAQGGTTILSETPEIYGAEHLLIGRATSGHVADKLMQRIRWWEDYCARNLGDMNNNPSPGNKAGGLTTIFEKSLGAVAKGGRAPLSAVYEYGEQITQPGFVFVDTPGYDPCSVTGQIASGANLIVFTTGRGSVSGFKPSPCIKVATNSEMFAKMREDMDLNAGDILSNGVSLEGKARQIFERIIEVASGSPTKSELQGFGDNEFVPWQIGAVM